MVGRLAAFFPLADPLAPIDLLDVYAGEGVDYVEFGWPAKDPYLDGPDVRDAMKRAGPGDPAAALISACGMLARHIAGPRALLMTYAEPGHPALTNLLLFDAIDALLVVAPAGDRTRISMETQAQARGVAVSSFLALPLAEADIAAATRASGYVMLQAAPGVTGPRATLDPVNAARIGDLASQRNCGAHPARLRNFERRAGPRGDRSRRRRRRRRLGRVARGATGTVPSWPSV